MGAPAKNSPFASFLDLRQFRKITKEIIPSKIKKIHVHATFRFSTLWPLDFCKVCVHIQWGVENFILFLGCFHKKRELPINWKHTVRESFSGPIKIDVTFLGFLLGNFNMREVGHHQKQRFFFKWDRSFREVFKDLLKLRKLCTYLQGMLLEGPYQEWSSKKKFLIKEDYQFLMRLCVQEGFSEFIKIALIFFFFVRRRGRVREIC